MIRYLQCPYCPKHVGKHSRAVPKSVGKFRIKIIESRNILIFQCQKCLKTFRVSMMGVPLLWADMDHTERRAFKQAKWNKNKRGKQDGKKQKTD